MGVHLSIQVSSTLQPKKMELDFLHNEEWTVDMEQVLLQKVQEVLALARKDGIALKLQLEIVAREPEEIFFQIKKKLNHAKETSIGHHKLSLREIEILGLIMLGHTNQEIADKLYISFETVRSHRKNILEKTGAKNTAALINYYHQTFFDK